MLELIFQGFMEWAYGLTLECWEYFSSSLLSIMSMDYGAISTMPEIPGLMLWKSGHAGVYIGGGYAIEAMGTSKGVVKTKVSDRNWQGWGKLPYIDYREGN